MIQPYPRTMRELTSLRFFAAFWVVIYHYCWWLPFAGAREIPVVRAGGIGVDFFFVLSGFILAHAHFDQLERGRVAARPFITKRLAKIYPMHLATLLFYVALLAGASVAHHPLPNPERYTATQFVLTVLLLQAFQPRDAGSWNFPSWSISAEWFAYLLFPFLAPRIVRRVTNTGGLLIAATLLLLAFWAAAPSIFGTGFFGLHSNFGIYRIVPEFLLGLSLYAWGRQHRLAPLAHRAAVPLLAAAVLVLSAFDASLPSLAVLALLILAGAEAARGGRGGPLTWPALIFLGEASYSLYMIHVPVATVLLQGAKIVWGAVPVGMVVAAVVAAVALSALCFLWIERPAQRLVLRIGLGRPVRPVDLGPAPQVPVSDDLPDGRARDSR